MKLVAVVLALIALVSVVTAAKSRFGAAEGVGIGLQAAEAGVKIGLQLAEFGLDKAPQITQYSGVGTKVAGVSVRNFAHRLANILQNAAKRTKHVPWLANLQNKLSNGFRHGGNRVHKNANQGGDSMIQVGGFLANPEAAIGNQNILDTTKKAQQNARKEQEICRNIDGELWCRPAHTN